VFSFFSTPHSRSETLTIFLLYHSLESEHEREVLDFVTLSPPLVRSLRAYSSDQAGFRVTRFERATERLDSYEHARLIEFFSFSFTDAQSPRVSRRRRMFYRTVMRSTDGSLSAAEWAVKQR
jgi:hypothetical protein